MFSYQRVVLTQQSHMTSCLNLGWLGPLGPVGLEQGDLPSPGRQGQPWQEKGSRIDNIFEMVETYEVKTIYKWVYLFIDYFMKTGPLSTALDDLDSSGENSVPAFSEGKPSRQCPIHSWSQEIHGTKLGTSEFLGKDPARVDLWFTGWWCQVL